MGPTRALHKSTSLQRERIETRPRLPEEEPYGTGFQGPSPKENIDLRLSYQLAGQINIQGDRNEVKNSNYQLTLRNKRILVPLTVCCIDKYNLPNLLVAQTRSGRRCCRRLCIQDLFRSRLWGTWE